jgi:hypothetical protein
VMQASLGEGGGGARLAPSMGRELF